MKDVRVGSAGEKEEGEKLSLRRDGKSGEEIGGSVSVRAGGCLVFLFVPTKAAVRQSTD